jgi:hypothetical protein
MKRREFITLLGGAAAWPLAARAQESGRVYRLGAMIPAGRQTPAVIAFFDEMRLFGFIENQNLIVLPNGFGVRNDELVERAEAFTQDGGACGLNRHPAAALGSPTGCCTPPRC